MKIISISLFILGLLISASASGEATLDILVILDRSGSMRTADPQRDSIKAIELLISLLSPANRLGMATFSEHGEIVFPLTRLDTRANRQSLVEQARLIKMNGSLTDFGAGLDLAYKMHNASAPAAGKRMVLLFSDGRVDMGKAEASLESRRSILAELIPRFRDASIPIYTIAFSPDADRDFLDGIARISGGTAFPALGEKQIYENFIRVFEATEQPLMTPVLDNQVAVDANVQQLKLLVGKQPGHDAVGLVDPFGKAVGPKSQLPGLDWVTTPYFDRVLVDRPEGGKWRITGSSGENKAYIVSEVDQGLKAPTLARVGESIEVETWISYQGEPIGDPIILKDLRLELNLDGQRQAPRPDLQPTANGRYKGSLSLRETGVHRVSVVAKHPLFERVKEATIVVFGAPVPLVATAPLPAAANIPATPPPSKTQAAAPPPPAPQRHPPPANPERTGGVFKNAVAIAVKANTVLLAIGLAVWGWKYSRGRPAGFKNRDGKPAAGSEKAADASENSHVA